MASNSAGSKTITGQLKRIIGSPVGEFISLYDTDVCIGRSKKSEICINDLNVSRKHCIFNYSTNGWLITDLGGVNGTFLDNDRLPPNEPRLLKDGSAIYLGPPAEAPVAFVFIKYKNEEGTSKTVKSITEASISVTPPIHKRRAETHGCSTQSKKHSPGASNHPLASSQDTTDGDLSGNMSDVSISSLDSLRTRIRKINSVKKKKRSPVKIDTMITASTSASPSLSYSIKFSSHLPSRYNANAPSTSSHRTSAAENVTSLIKPNMFKELDTLFNDGSDTLSENTNERPYSESLLNESVVPSGASQSNDPSRSIQNLYERMQKSNSVLREENSEQKQKLDKFIEESKDKKETKLGQMIEEELICNICTEVFIKATALGCSHTFCEHCIKEWKKKQRKCPMCREVITSETRILIMDNFIDKVVEKLDKEYQDKRKEVIASREEAKVKAKSKKHKRKKSPRYRPARNARSSATRETSQSLREIRLGLLNSVPYHVIDLTVIEDGIYSHPSDGSW